MTTMLAEIPKNSNETAYNFEFECKQHMAANGYHFEGAIIPDGNIKRFSIDANKAKRDEWYIGYQFYGKDNKLSYTVVYGSHSTGDKFKYTSWGDGDGNLTPEEAAKLKHERQLREQQAEQALAELHDQKAALAQKIWKEAALQPPNDTYTGYIKKKHIEPIGCKYGTYEECPSLIIPLYNIQRQLRSLQFIFLRDGKYEKRFLKGSQLDGSFFIMCPKPLDACKEIYLCEGWATAVSVYMALGKKHAVAFCLSSANLFKAAESIKSAHKDIKIVVCSDNDANQTGQKAAKRICDAFGALMYTPTLNDFNDVHVHYGLSEVLKQLTPPSVVPAISYPASPSLNIPLSLLPLPLQKYINALSSTTAAHPAMLLSSVLTMCAAYLGNTVCIPRGEYFQDLYPNLWMLCISDSGEYKSTALNAGSAIAKKQQIEIREEIKKTTDSMKLRQAKDDDIAREIKHLKAHDVLLPNRTTMEGLLDHLETNPSGVMYHAEFGAFLANLSKTYNADTMGTLTDLYDVPSAYVLKTIGKGERMVIRPAISLCGVSTMSWLKKSFHESDLEGGFLLRFLTFSIPSSGTIPAALPTSFDPYFEHIENEFASHIASMRTAHMGQKQMTLDSDARKLYEQYHWVIFEKSFSFGSNLFVSYAKRWSPSVLKLAIIMELISNPQSQVIHMPAIAAAGALVLECMNSTKQLFDQDLTSSKPEADALKLFEYIAKKTKAKGEPIKKKALLTSKVITIPYGKKAVEYYDEALELLMQQGKIACIISESKMNNSFYLTTNLDQDTSL